ncbi:MAG TPA: preprotein translocase subunit YajC [Candidatus Acidoferrales bacterium]|nr:preprotein translocase subunit YajC [Candidatus Acidoferrales bacterium]
MIDLAFAQAAQEPSVPGILATPLPAFLLVFLIFYFLLIRPQQKRARQHREMLSRLKKNDEVITTGGIYGKIVALNEKDNTIMLEIAPNVRIKFSRAHVSSLARSDKPEKASPKEASE